MTRRTHKGNKSKKIGTRFEYRCKTALEGYGYEVKRSYSSKGVYDLLAIKRVDPIFTKCNAPVSMVLWVQCKYCGRQKLSPEEIDGLQERAIKYGGLAIAAMCPKKGGPINWYDITDSEWKHISPALHELGCYAP
jgi:Holliday junction resolvase